MPVCEKYFGSDAGTEGGDKIENIVLCKKASEREMNLEKAKLRGSISGNMSSLGI